MIRPNPSSGIFTINNLNKNVLNTISVFNVLGQIILNEMITEQSNYEINLNKYPSGNYLLKIENELEIITEKLIKN